MPYHEGGTGRDDRRRSVAARRTFFQPRRHEVATEDEQWRVEVSGIHFGHDGRWLQLNLCGDVNYSVTLKIDTVDVRAIHDNLAACLAAAPPQVSAPPF